MKAPLSKFLILLCGFCTSAPGSTFIFLPASTENRDINALLSSNPGLGWGGASLRGLVYGMDISGWGEVVRRVPNGAELGKNWE